MYLHMCICVYMHICVYIHVYVLHVSSEMQTMQLSHMKVPYELLVHCMLIGFLWLYGLLAHYYYC